MKRLIILYCIVFACVSITEAQKRADLNKREQRKWDEIVRITTDPSDGSRWFYMDEMENIRIKITSDSYHNGYVYLNLDVLNLAESTDEEICIYSINQSTFFTLKGGKENVSKIDDIFVPAGGLRKVVMMIATGSDAGSFHTVDFGIQTKGGTNYHPYIHELKAGY